MAAPDAKMSDCTGGQGPDVLKVGIGALLYAVASFIRRRVGKMPKPDPDMSADEFLTMEAFREYRESQDAAMRKLRQGQEEMLHQLKLWRAGGD